MKKVLSTLMLLFVAIMLHAVPAKPGQWKNIKLADGTTIRVELRGDEHARWWQAEDGRMFVKASNADYYIATDMAKVKQKAMKRSMSAKKTQMKRMKTMRKAPNPMFQGQRKGLIILAQYKDTKFKDEHDVELYEKIANQLNYKENGFYGSVRDYFRDQSDGQFDLSFDVRGIVQLSQNTSYYGGNDNNGDDKLPGEMITEALDSIKTTVNFADYDWDGDGIVEEVFVLYAGKGEANGGSANTIWPHMWSLEDANGQMWEYGDYKVNVYACSSELNGIGDLDGVGTFCHEFSHCMGYPDMYDTSYNGNFGMDDYDLMCGGSYNGNGMYPAGYSAYERSVAGWIELQDLTGETGAVTNLQPINNQGQGFIVRNQAHPDECFVIENRQKTKWDTYLPGKGLLISYVDYDSLVWAYNIPNTICDYTYYANYYPDEYDFWVNYKNDHERLTVIHADNDKVASRVCYPYNGNDSLTNRSLPAGKLYHANSNGKKFMNIAITKITQNSDRTMSFNYAPDGVSSTVKPDPTDAFFYESFDQCSGTGGNDETWTGGSSQFKPDLTGWTAKTNSTRYGADRCARFGNSSNIGWATTPEFNVDGETSFAFMAAPYGTDGTSLTVSIEAVEGSASISPTSFTMTNNDWTVCQATITGTGKVKVTITPAKRMFLDEVVAKKPTTTGINVINSNNDKVKNTGWYSLDGRYLGNRGDILPHGIYIHNGKKVVK